jgi:hypothetical protein
VIPFGVLLIHRNVVADVLTCRSLLALGAEPTIFNCDSYLPDGRELSRYESGLLQPESVKYAQVYGRVQIGRDVLRTRRVDASCPKTRQRYFKAKFAVTLPARARGGIPREAIQTRYALVTDILRVKFGEVYVILLRADWWPALAASIDRKTQNVVLEANRMSIESQEPFILASQIENQVVIVPREKELPGDRATLSVLDRSFYAHCDVLLAEVA